MKLILDTNIIISALIRDSITRRLIISMNIPLYYPEAGLREIFSHKKLILQKSGLNEKNFNIIMNRLFNYINIIPDKRMEKHIGKAKKIMKPIDSKDAIFLAAALSYEDAIIWSDDKDFEKQTFVKVVKTKEMLRHF